MNRLVRAQRDLMLSIRGWRAQRRLRAATILRLTESVEGFETRVRQLEAEIDELRADSRRVAEMRIQLEDYLAEHE